MRRMPKVARPGTMAQAVHSVQTCSEQPIPLRRRAARMRRIGRLGVAPEVRENSLDDRRFLDARDHPQRPAAAPAGLDVDGKHPLQTLRPAQRLLPSARRGLAIRLAPARGSGPVPRHHPRAIRAPRCEHAVISGQVRARLRH